MPDNRVDHPPAVRGEPRICVLREWKPASGSSSLLGKATVAFSGGWTVAGVPVFRRGDGSLSVGAPDAPLVDADGQQLRDENGKRRYTKVISFETQQARDRWNAAILAALAQGGIA
jgi:hypothetical protein